MAGAMAARSLRIARLLLVAAAGLTAGTAVYIGVQTSDRGAASPWIALLLIDAAGFVGAAALLDRDARRGTTLAVASAIGMAGLGTITGWGAGMLSFPAAGIGALAAWAALLHPPRRPVVVAFALYLAVGLALAAPTFDTALLYPWTLAFVAVWPVRLLLFPASSAVLIYAALGLAAATAILALARPRPPAPSLTVGGGLVVGAIAVLVGVAAVAIFNVYAVARADTSARFELIDPLVLIVVFAGGVASAAGAVALRLRPRPLAALALGLGAAALFMTFTARPAVTCEPNGTSQGIPLAWQLRTVFAGDTTQTYSGGSSSGTGNGDGVSTGDLRYGDRMLTFRCDGDRLVEYGESTP